MDGFRTFALAFSGMAVLAMVCFIWGHELAQVDMGETLERRCLLHGAIKLNGTDFKCERVN